MTDWPPASPKRVVIRCASVDDHSYGIGEHVVNASSRPDIGGTLILPFPVDPVRRSPPADCLEVLWENLDIVKSWADKPCSIVVLCDTGSGASRVLAAIIRCIIMESHTNVTDQYPPDPGDGGLAEMYDIASKAVGIDQLEEELFWFLNGDPFGHGARFCYDY